MPRGPVPGGKPPDHPPKKNAYRGTQQPRVEVRHCTEGTGDGLAAVHSRAAACGSVGSWRPAAAECDRSGRFGRECVKWHCGPPGGAAIDCAMHAVLSSICDTQAQY